LTRRVAELAFVAAMAASIAVATSPIEMAGIFAVGR